MFRAKTCRKFITSLLSLILTCEKKRWLSVAATALRRPRCFENRDPKAGAMKHWVRTPLEREIAEGRLRVILYQHIDEITAHEVSLTTETGERRTIPNDVAFILVGSDADLTLLKKLGVQTAPGKLTEMPVYDPETYETNVRGVYVAGHFTNARHIKAAIDVPRRIVPLIAKSLQQAVGS